MNVLDAEVLSVETDGTLSLVAMAAGGLRLSALLVESGASCDYLTAGSKVQALFKETEVAIARDLGGAISLANRFTAVISEVRTSGILSEIFLDTECDQRVVSIITAKSAARLELGEGDKVEWLVKSNEISIKGREREDTA
ncbi:hypothetical protein AGMMS50229_13310 [Campylobacterota bacterium]|nr:hypothetical protein AGMMS50229_13310 [Campylobacterota bacterium]